MIKEVCGMTTPRHPRTPSLPTHAPHTHTKRMNFLPANMTFKHIVFPLWWIIVSIHHVFSYKSESSFFMYYRYYSVIFDANLFHSLMLCLLMLGMWFCIVWVFLKVCLLTPVICQPFLLRLFMFLYGWEHSSTDLHFILSSTRLSKNFELFSTFNIVEADFACSLTHGHKWILPPNIRMFSIFSSNVW